MQHIDLLPVYLQTSDWQTLPVTQKEERLREKEGWDPLSLYQRDRAKLYDRKNAWDSSLCLCSQVWMELYSIAIQKTGRAVLLLRTRRLTIS